MQAPIIAGTVIKGGIFVRSYPINLEARVIDTGISKGQLVTTRGAVQASTGPGRDRGGIVWNGTHYRVMGSKLVSVDTSGTVSVLADVGDDAAPVKMDYGFDRLAVASSARMYYWNGTLTDITDPDLGTVLDMVWMDGYYATTDGTYVILTDLNEPTSIDPLRYGNADEDPDSVTGLLKYSEELYVLGAHTIQVMRNVGGNGFPFAVVQGATIPVGCVSATAKCMVGGDGFAFVGSARGEPLAVWYFNGTLNRLSDETIDAMLAEEEQPELIEMECRAFAAERQIVLHLAGKSLALSVATTDVAGASAWSVLHSGHFEPYRLRHAVLFDGRHWVGDADSATLGTLTDTPEHFGEATDWRFDASLLFDPGGMTVAEVELFGEFPTVENAVYFSATREGVHWSREVSRVLTGRRDERVIWRPCVPFPVMGSFRFRGRGRVAIARCEVT